jgi:hypothetical protein
MARKDSRIEGFAEDLGRLLGTAQNKAEGWLGQRKQIAKSLEGIRDTATKLLGQLGTEAGRAYRRGRRGYASKRGPGRPTRRRLSAKARAAISAAQKARWAKVRAEKKR